MKAYYILPLLIVTAIGCQKDWLEAKSDNSLVVPSTIQDLQALLDYEALINRTNVGLKGNGHPAELAEAGTDNYYMYDADWSALSGDNIYGKNTYIFDKDIFTGLTNVRQWNNPYQRIFYANTALDGIGKIVPTSAEQAAWNNVKGSALFIRAYNYWWLAQVFCKPYDASTATENLGLPLRLNADLNEKSVRSSITDTYERIITDLNAAIPLLPDTGATVTRPSKAAAYAMMARTYMSMGNYPAMLLYADSALQIKSALIDYNTLNTSSTYPVPQYNKEVIYQDVNTVSSVFTGTLAKVDTLLYAMYETNDLRKSVFFKNQGTYIRFYGGYNGGAQLFAGILLDEIYLMRAEGFARSNQLVSATADLKTVLSNRYMAGTLNLSNIVDQYATLEKILLERRKELCFRGLRWVDVKRLNKDGAGIVIKRILYSQEYLLTPNSEKYAYPIPDDIIQLSGMQQNMR